MKRIIKIVFAFLFIVCTAVFGFVYFASENVADSYKVNRGEELRLDFNLPITAVYDADNHIESRAVGESYEVDLKLFGVIPFSTVEVQVVDESYVQVLGNPFGMKMYTDGVLVTQSSDVLTQNGKVNPALNAGIKVGDYIKTANGKTVGCNEDLLQIVTESGGSVIRLEAVRNGKTFSCDVQPVIEKETGVYRIGIWVRDSSAGIGTLTFYSPSNGVVCGLGHGICDGDTETILEIEKGEMVEANIVSVIKGVSGSPGALKGKLTYDTIADVSLNCETGVYGVMRQDISSSNLTQVALKQEVRDGDAQILCTVSGDRPKLYSCRIKKTGDYNSKTQNLIVTVTDEELINATGGIVQGMSGSPILQDGKLVGALTHVLVSDSKTGYGIYAENMLDVAESVAENKALKQAS